MKNLRRLTVILVATVMMLAASSSVAVCASNLVFSDEFNGPLDSSSWINKTPWNTRYTTGELQYYDPANCTFADGVMTLKSENRAMNGYAYTSGIVTSLPKTKFSYGYFEMRAKLPKGQGIWPAFWLTNDDTFEIDIMEMLGDRPNRVYGTMHRHDAGLKDFQGIKDGADYSAGFHTFAVDWQPTHVKWYVDDVLYASYTGAVQSDPMWICLNTAVGGAWPGSPTAATSFPVNYDVDYLRVYDTKPVGADQPVVTEPVVTPPVVTDPVVAPPSSTPTVVQKPVVRRTRKTISSTTYKVSGSVVLGSAAPVAAATVTPAVYTASADSAPAVVEVQVERKVKKQWRVYKKIRVSSASSKYIARTQLKRGTYRFRTLVSGAGVPAAKSAATKSFKVR